MDGEVIIGLDLDSKSFDAQIEETQEKLKNLTEEFGLAKKWNLPEEDLMHYQSEIEKTKNKLVDLLGKGWNNVRNQTEKTNVNLSKMIKKITHVGLAIFGIRSAYSFIRQAMSSVLAGNEKMKTQFDGMKQSFYNAFAPIIEKIINLMRTLMAYVNYVWQRLFHHALFAEKGVLNASKKAKELNKQMAGFDEAEALQDNSSSSTGSGKYDLGLSDIKIPDWLVKIMDWVEKNPKLSKIIFGLTAFTLFGGWKLASGIGAAIAGILGSKNGGTGLLGLQALLVGGALAGAAYIVWNGFDLLGEHVAGIKELRDEMKSLEEDRKRANNNVRQTSTENMKLANSYIETARTTGLNSEQLSIMRGHIKNVIKENDILINSEELSEDTKLQLRRENEHLIKSYQVLYEEGLLPTEEEEYKYYKFLKDVFPMGIDATNQELLGTKEAFEALDKKYNTKYQVEISESGAKKVQSSLDKLGDSFEKLYKKWNTSSLGKAVNKVASNLGIVVNTEKHATGGILNLPGRGVPVNHIAGEAGREGMIPMDNESQMRIIGQELAKYVTINNYLTTNVDSRKLNTILKQSENRERLANNG